MKHDRGFKYQEYEIISKEEVAPDTFLFDLKGRINFNPGQFVQVELEHYGEFTLALCSDPEEKNFFSLCIRAAGGATNHVVKLSPGDKLKVRGPYGNGWPIFKLIGKNIVLIAGGMGLVPIKPLLDNLVRYRTEFKKIYLIAGFKTDHHILFNDYLRKIKNKISVLKISVEHACRNFDGHQGLITEALEPVSVTGEKSVAILCGPEVMIPYCNKVLFDKNFCEKNIYISFERRMECGIGICQHCNIGKYLVCEDGPVFSLDKIKAELTR